MFMFFRRGICHSQEMSEIFRVKCVVAGESTVGKTSIILALQSQLNNNYAKSYNMTLGVELSTKAISIPDTSQVIEFYLYDSSGKDVYKDILLKCWEKPEIVLLVFDVTRESTFQSLSKWLDMVKSKCEDNFILGALLANKIDETEKRIVTSEQGKEMAQKFGFFYFECSAKTVGSITETFNGLSKECSQILKQSRNN